MEEYECEDCSAQLQEVDRFEVHHKDENPMNGDIDNLVGLCRACHFKRHGKSPPESLEDWKERVNNL